MKNKLSFLTVVLFLLVNIPVLACEVCEKQQPKVLRGVAHGVGPQSDWDYVWVGGIIAVVLISLFYSVKFIIRPGEKEMNHIKHSIFN